MNIENIKRTSKLPQSSKVQINIKISVELSEWLKRKDYSPTAIFMEAVKEIGYKEQ